MRLDWMTLRVTMVIIANVKSDEVKQSINSLEKYRLFTEDKLRPFIHKKIDQCGSLVREIMLEGEELFTYTTSINSRRKKQPHNVF